MDKKMKENRRECKVWHTDCLYKCSNVSLKPPLTHVGESTHVATCYFYVVFLKRIRGPEQSNNKTNKNKYDYGKDYWN